MSFQNKEFIEIGGPTIVKDTISQSLPNISNLQSSVTEDTLNVGMLKTLTGSNTRKLIQPEELPLGCVTPTQPIQYDEKLLYGPSKPRDHAEKEKFGCTYPTKLNFDCENEDCEITDYCGATLNSEHALHLEVLNDKIISLEKQIISLIKKVDDIQLQLFENDINSGKGEKTLSVPN